MLVGRDSQGIAPEDEAALIGGCLERGEEMLRRKEISTSAALSQALFTTALKLARHRGLMNGDAATLGERRRTFADELDRTLVAIRAPPGRL